jgi:hypothetical protein
MDVCLFPVWLNGGRLRSALFITTLHHYFEEKRIVCAKANCRGR